MKIITVIFLVFITTNVLANNLILDVRTSFIDTTLRHDRSGEPDSFDTANYTRFNKSGLIEVCLIDSRPTTGEFISRKTANGGIGAPSRGGCVWESISNSFKRKYPDNIFNNYGYMILSDQSIRIIASIEVETSADSIK